MYVDILHVLAVYFPDYGFVTPFFSGTGSVICDNMDVKRMDLPQGMWPVNKRLESNLQTQ